MVNLIEPFLVSLLKPKENPHRHGQGTVFETKLSRLPQVTPVQKILHVSPLKQDPETLVHLKLTRIKDSFLSKENSTHWIDSIQQKGLESKDLKHLWNFLFPEIPWTKERVDWVDRRKKRSFQGIFGKEENSYYFCILFDSSKTGKIWIFYSDLKTSGKESELLIQVEKETSFIKLQKDLAALKIKLSGLGICKFRIWFATDADENHLNCRRGIFV